MRPALLLLLPTLSLALTLGCDNRAVNPLVDGGGTVDAAPPAPDLSLGPDDRELVMAPFTVDPGGEVFKCQNFANPFGEDVEVSEWESHMSAGSHHLLVFYKSGATDGAVTDCSGLEFNAGPYGSQTPDALVTYPPGVAIQLQRSVGLRFASHYLNSSAKPITTSVRLVLRRAKAGTITDHAGFFFFNQTAFLVPAGTNNYTIPTKTCIAPQDMTILYALGHMHQHALNLTARLDGQPIYSLDTWDNAPYKKFAPGLVVKKGQKFTFACTYNNPGDRPLFFGDSAKTNEMCIFDGQFYPTMNNQDVICN